MRVRYENWVNGLNGDWCVSRQRFFGVPFPIWYPIDETGRITRSRSAATKDGCRSTRRPTCADGYRPTSAISPAVQRRSRHHGHLGHLVADAADRRGWLTIRISSRGVPDGSPARRRTTSSARGCFDRCCARISSTTLPWAHAALSGCVLDPDRKKMSKSKGNVVTPMALLEEHGSDGVRYWAASGGPGVDTVFDAGQMKVGRRLAMKVLNASRFVLMNAEPVGPIASAVDRAMLRNLASVVDEATQALENYEYGRALDLAEREFWGSATTISNS
jgi:valyl-tRNA synthetase